MAEEEGTSPPLKTGNGEKEEQKKKPQSNGGGHKQGGHDKRRWRWRKSSLSYHPDGRGRRALCALVLVTILILAGITALVLWIVYRPHKPKFAVVGAAIYDLNYTSAAPAPAPAPYRYSYMISTTIQFVLSTRNPNDRASIYYDRLSAFVTYKDEPITLPLMLPPLHHESDSTVGLSPMFGGAGAPPVPVSPEVVNGLRTEEAAFGAANLRLVLKGRLRWKLGAGAITTGHYSIYVRCDVLVGYNKGLMEAQVQVPLQQLVSPVCQVN